MNPQQIEKIRIAVAEELGFTHNGVGYWHKDNSVYTLVPEETGRGYDYTDMLPDYPTSLDSCVEFEKDMDEDYWHVLLQVCDPDRHWSDAITSLAFMRATPLQRCVAFLKTRNIEIPE